MIQKIGPEVKLDVNNKQVNESNENFGNYFKDALKEVNRLENHADNLTKKLAMGEDVDIHDVMIATEKANIALQLTIQVRNKAVDAYNEIMRMQI